MRKNVTILSPMLPPKKDGPQGSKRSDDSLLLSLLEVALSLDFFPLDLSFFPFFSFDFFSFDFFPFLSFFFFLSFPCFLYCSMIARASSTVRGKPKDGGGRRPPVQDREREPVQDDRTMGPGDKGSNSKKMTHTPAGRGGGGGSCRPVLGASSASKAYSPLWSPLRGDRRQGQ